MSRLAVFGAALALVLLAGCRHPARVRFANEYGCPEDEVSVRELGGAAWRTSGCGRAVTYVCSNELCVVDSPVAEATANHPAQPPLTESEPPRNEPGRLTLLSGSFEGAPAVRMDVDHVYDAVFFYARGRNGDWVVVRVTPPAGAPARCSGVAIEIPRGPVARFEPRSAAHGFGAPLSTFDELRGDRHLQLNLCGTLMRLTSGETLVVQRFLREIREAGRPADQPGESPGDDPAASSVAAAQSTDASTRTWIEARGDVVLACVPGDVVVVVVERRADESPVVALRPPHAGTPEEACARAALGDAPPGEPGVTVHALRR